MSKVFNKVYGPGFKAFITVTYPSGTCTVSLGDKSFTHTGGGTHTFTVNKKGTWIVTATRADGTTESSNVSITFNGQSASVTLKCRRYFYNNGDVSSLTGGWSSYQGGSNQGTYLRMETYATGGHLLETKNSINFTGYTKVGFTITNVSWTDKGRIPNYPQCSLTAAGVTLNFTNSSQFGNTTYYLSLGTTKTGTIKIWGDSAWSDQGLDGVITFHVTQIWAE